MTQPVAKQASATPRKPPPKASLRRELLAILFLYGVLSVLPVVVGAMFAP
ncbi:MAG: hypothetical protein IPK26_23155 [Planctomycetes bacterium]|nr:hypothetical protein [Planctomycetota bacterium]